VCKKKRRFIEGRAMIVVRRGAIELAALCHVLEQGDELGEKRECIWG
jgi:hypothetical protein